MAPGTGTHPEGLGFSVKVPGTRVLRFQVLVKQAVSGFGSTKLGSLLRPGLVILVFKVGFSYFSLKGGI